MKISFDLEVEDWMVFQEYYRGKKIPLYKALMPLLFITAIVLIIINAIYLSYQNVSIFTVFSCFILITILYIFFVKKKSKESLRQRGLAIKVKNPEAFGIRQMTFNDKEIEISTLSSNKTLPFSELEKYEEIKDYFFLYSRKGVVYIIPKQKIKSEEVDVDGMLRNYFSEI